VDVPDGVTSSQTNPLGDGSVLLLRSCELYLRTEGLVALWRILSVPFAFQYEIIFSSLCLCAAFREHSDPIASIWRFEVQRDGTYRHSD
jgi:hypothetical protein